MKGKLILATAAGSAAIAGTVAVNRCMTWWHTWGVDPAEAGSLLPGDDLVADAQANDTRGITIDAPPERVWPWLVQMGYGRAGWYSWDRLDMKGDSADRILVEHQGLAVGDTVPTDPAGGFEVRVLAPGEALVLYVDGATSAAQRTATPQGDDVPAGLAASGKFLETAVPSDFAASWTFVLRPLEGGRTRLVERFRARMGSQTAGPRFLGPLLGFGVFVMTQKQMTGIRDRAEREATAAMPYATAS